MSDRSVCWFCTHMFLWSGSPDYSELTPGSDMSMGCEKKVWHLDTEGDTLADFRRKITSSVTCEKFEPPTRGGKA